ncbi:hinge domain of cleavage stimulation factor subunit 2-domain-containing protein [Fomitopsis serialis]|uniref:hinge domain of cleavage stimulation factor subunit 2-domain-containing protein n=1 Tax=Fomitopsis serialis TaxID=139415 RepID=UPI002008C5F1|nr:hinge domain of cleavage stimulation factor subunit 2-domain-containing protein [Neoantrodia serialis]KAH9916913.1 hinge domain of cleavage stimulation factor subunit 2-domain-containing protein [Neoantrodia serialis]
MKSIPTPFQSHLNCADHETAESAVRNLNGHDLGGRPLRIDLADSDPFLEGKTTVRESASRRANPPGSTSLDTISQMLATANPAQILEVLAQMKAFVITHPEQARALLVAHPQLGYALFQALLLNNIVDPAILQRMLQATNAATPSQPAKALAPPAAVPPPMHQSTPQHQPQPQHPPPMSAPYSQGPLQHPPFPPHLQSNIPQTHTPVHHPTPPVPPPSMFPPPSAHLSHTQAQAPPYYRPPPPPSMPVQVAPVSQPPPIQPSANPPPVAPALDPAQRDMLMQVLNLTQDQINSLPPAEREQIQQLRKQFGIAV